ncbi:MAG TPA: aldo/keto reductase [Gaiella sp.]|nr:aldo/keto reductase [Gaiella sp.]
METTSLGPSDLQVSRVGLGCNNFGRRLDRDATAAVVEAALEVGITFLDTADVYGGGDSERFIGEALRRRRGDVVIATKFGQDTGLPGPGGSRGHLRAAVDASLERLGTDVVDLYYYHRPDGVTPIAETVGAMRELVDEGKVRWLGLSNVDAGQLDEAVATGDAVVAVQNRYSLMDRRDDAEVLPRCRELGIGYVPYFPLESGLLTGKYRRGEPAPAGARLAGRGDDLSDERFDRVDALESFAADRGRTLLELAIGGLASIPGIASVIAGATRPEQVRANAAAGSWTLDARGLVRLAALSSQG